MATSTVMKATGSNEHHGLSHIVRPRTACKAHCQSMHTPGKHDLHGQRAENWLRSRPMREGCLLKRTLFSFSLISAWSRRVACRQFAARPPALPPPNCQKFWGGACVEMWENGEGGTWTDLACSEHAVPDAAERAECEVAGPVSPTRNSAMPPPSQSHSKQHRHYCL